MRLYFRLNTLIAVVVLWASPLSAQPIRIITVDEPPANFIDVNGGQSGYVLDVVKSLQKQLNNQAKIEFMPEARALNLAKSSPNIVLFSFSRTANRENQFHWVGKVMEKTWRAFALNEFPISVSSVEELKQLNGIGVVRGDIRQEWLANRGFQNLSIVTRHKQNLKMLMKGRVDIIVHESHAIAYLMEELNLPRTHLKPILDINKSDVYILMSKSTPVDTVSQWQTAFAKLKSSKRLYEIAKSWRLKISQDLKVGAKLKNGILVF